jgi:chaperonin GroES
LKRPKKKKSKKAASSFLIPPRKNPLKASSSLSAPAKTDDNGKKVPFEVKKGDRVLVSKYGGTEIKLDNKEYKILSADDILAIIE